jgi:hypothetical protein
VHGKPERPGCVRLGRQLVIHTIGRALEQVCGHAMSGDVSQNSNAHYALSLCYVAVVSRSAIFIDVIHKSQGDIRTMHE